MPRFTKNTATNGRWTDWIEPIRKGYKIACCDCDLVHDVDFRIRSGRTQFRVARNNRSTAMMRRHRKAA